MDLNAVAVDDFVNPLFAGGAPTASRGSRSRPVNPASNRSRGGGPAGHISLPEPPYLDRPRQEIPRTSTSYFLHGHRGRDLLRCSLHSNNRVAVEFLPMPATAKLASKVGSSPFRGVTSTRWRFCAPSGRSHDRGGAGSSTLESYHAEVRILAPQPSSQGFRTGFPPSAREAREKGDFIQSTPVSTLPFRRFRWPNCQKSPAGTSCNCSPNFRLSDCVPISPSNEQRSCSELTGFRAGTERCCG